MYPSMYPCFVIFLFCIHCICFDTITFAIQPIMIKQLSCVMGCLRPWRHKRAMQVMLWPNFSKVSPWRTLH